MSDFFEDLKAEDFIDEFPLGLKTAVENLKEQGFSYEQIGIEMSKNPSFGLSAKGGEKWNEELFFKIMEELRKILCTKDSRFEEIRGKLKGEAKNSAKAITALLAGWVGANIGVTAAVCVPFVILLIATILQAGFSVFCNETETE